MAEINAQLVKGLRDKTGAGMMDCKRALAETEGDLEAAVGWLRSKGILQAAKRSDRTAAEGLVGLVVEGNRGAVAELNTETDFVARNDKFKAAAAACTKIALQVGGDHGRLLEAPSPDGDGSVSDLITRLNATIGENIHLRRCAFVEVGQGVIAPYVHHAAAPGLGRVAVLVALESAGEAGALDEIGHRIAMHIAASAPLWVSVEDVPAEVIAERRAALTQEAEETGKPADIIEKMIEGRIRKFYEQVVLTAQAFVINPEQTVAQALKEAEEAAGAAIKVRSFVRFRMGEGVEKKT
jgi:elongation factor Ts